MPTSAGKYAASLSLSGKQIHSHADTLISAKAPDPHHLLFILQKNVTLIENLPLESYLHVLRLPQLLEIIIIIISLNMYQASDSYFLVLEYCDKFAQMFTVGVKL